MPLGGADGEDAAEFLLEEPGKEVCFGAAAQCGMGGEIALSLFRQISKADFQDDFFSGRGICGWRGWEAHGD